MKTTSKFSNMFIPSVLISISVIPFLFNSVLYPGFLWNHFGFRYLVFIPILCIPIYILFKKIGNKNTKYLIFSLSIILLLLIYFGNMTNNIFYANYTYSHFHYVPNQLSATLILTVISLVLIGDKAIIRKFFYVLIIFIFVDSLLTDVNTIIANNPLFIFRNISLNYDSRMEEEVGKNFYEYTLFVKNNTPENSTILIPPQGFPWPQTGNEAYMRYFLYPRKLINGKEKDAQGVDQVDYVLIDYGESKSYQYSYTNSWPKFRIECDYILSWNMDNNTVVKIQNKKCTFTPSADTPKWGLIKVKHI